MAAGTLPLLEREAELAAIDESLEAALAGRGTILLIEGPAGIGKTTIVDTACRRARTRGVRVLIARGSTLEGELAHGVARQLLEPPLHAASARERSTLLEGAAGLAAPAVLPSAGPLDTSAELGTDRRAPVIHGLYWLTANLSARTPLLLAVDDAQWSDAASLRFLAYLTRRLEDLPIVVMAALRTGEEAAEKGAIVELTRAPTAQVLRPLPLTQRAVRELTRGSLPGEPQPEFVGACHEATGGVPFLLTELLKTLAAQGIQPSQEAATAVTQLSSTTVGHATLLSLSRLSPTAVSVAQSVAVLERRAELRNVARLALLSEEEVLLARDALVSADILRPLQPMSFSHPIVRASVYDAIPAGQRSLAHAAAARILAEAGSDAEEVALHLLATEPGSSLEVVRGLRPAAAAALTRGAPQSAISYLGRAAAEASGSELRAQVLHELARAQSMMRATEAVANLREAMSLTQEPVTRARMALDLVDTLMAADRWDEAIAEAERALAELGDQDAETASSLEAFRAQMMALDARRVDLFESEWPRLAEVAGHEGRAARLMAALLASCAACRGAEPDEVAALARHALANGELMMSQDAEEWGPFPAAALAFEGQLDEALVAAEQMRIAALKRGSVYGFVRSSAVHALAHDLRGDLRAVEVDVRAAFDLARDGELIYALLVLLRWSMDALVERPQLDEVAATLETIDLVPDLAGSYVGAWMLETRGRLRLMSGRMSEACDDLRRCGELMTAFHTVNPVVSTWRSYCALAMPDSQRAEAKQLAAEELGYAKAAGMPRAESVALRAAGLLEGGETGIALLQEAAAVIERADAPLEQARTLVELGAALRRGRHRTAAQAPLRSGLDLAHRCGADRLAQHAEDELHSLGFKPRRRAIFGVDALTPSEARVGRQAARGMSNREIAQSLFVTSKTVESQLSSVYQKLEIRGREELAARLQDVSPPQ
jgi:DNA-binding CsgD family transcriptional regulator